MHLPNDTMEWLGMILILAGFFGSAAATAFHWSKGGLWQFIPPIFGAVIGIVVTLVWWATGLLTSSPLMAILIWVAIGWAFWIAVWLEVKFGK